MIIGAEVIILNTEGGKREILAMPIMLQSENLRADLKALADNIKDGKIIKLFLYEHWIDNEYKASLEREYAYLQDDFKTEKYLINYGQDFSRYYLGYLYVDRGNKSYSLPEGQAHKADDLNAVGEMFFSQDKESREITIFTPTRPDDIKVVQI